jgi:hypothetical protein
MRRADEVLLVIIIMDIYPLQNIAHAQSSLNLSFYSSSLKTFLGGLQYDGWLMID